MKRGYYIPPEDKEKLDKMYSERRILYDKYHIADEESNKLYNEMQSLEHDSWKLKHRNKPIPKELADKIETKTKEWRDALDIKKPLDEKRKGIYDEIRPIEEKWDKAADEDQFSQRNIIKSLGTRFCEAIDRQSKSFVDSMNKALNMKSNDWEWIPKESKRAKPSVKAVDILKAKKWRREVPETPERVGNEKDLPETFKPQDLLKYYGIRGVEYGNWMDEESSKHHTHLAGMALFDLANVLEIPIQQVSYNGRLALAFGARGQGFVGGVKGQGAAAHYEPLKTVINLTKFNGGGTIAHEWGHFMDNIIARVSNDDKSGRTLHASTGNVGSGVSKEIKTSMENVVKAMQEGDFSMNKTIMPNKAKWEKYTWRSIDALLQSGTSAQSVFDSKFKELKADIERKEKYYKGYMDAGAEWKLKHMAKANKKFDRDTKDLASYLATKSDKSIKIPNQEHPKVSKFFATALKQGEYYSSTTEMFARAFESYIYDKLDNAKTKNTYLVHGVSEKNVQNYFWYKEMDGVAHIVGRDDPEALPLMPYPEGEDRKRIFGAMDEFVKVLRETNTMEKSLMNLQTIGE